jgi:hypothetical protein
VLRSTASRRLERARERGRAGERAAITLLERAGYAIEALQPASSWTIECDGDRCEIELRADLLVSRAGRRFVAEVKTGDYAPQLSTAGTRRQLLEYSIAYAVDGVLLVDPEAKRIRAVRFPRRRERKPLSAWLWAAIGFAALAAWTLR